MKLAILAVLLMVLGITGILVGSILRVKEHYTDDRTDYGIVLDAGSVSTKAYIYQWRHKTESFVPYVSISKSDSKSPYIYTVHPGLATLAPNYTQVGDYLEPILSWARSYIPKDRASDTPIYLRGTGGLRQLSDFASDTLLSSVRRKLQDSNFVFDNSYASILTNTEEAGFGFLAVNALYDRFEPEESHLDPYSNVIPYGSLDLGGVSSEIAYKDYSPPSNYSFSFTVNTSMYQVYAQGIDGLGVNSARYTLNYTLFTNTTGNIVQNPCVPSGYNEQVTVNKDGTLHSFYLMGSSDAVACQQQVQALVSQLTQSIPRPVIDDDTRFAVADHYIKIKNFFKLKDNANLLELEAKTASLCGLNYGDALDHHKKFAGDVQNYCFMGYYVVTLLENFYGFDSTSRHIFWKDTVHHKFPVSWTLGSMLQHVSLIAPDTSSQDRIRHVRMFHTDGGVVLLFVSILLFVLGAVIFILQRRRPTDYVVITE